MDRFRLELLEYQFRSIVAHLSIDRFRLELLKYQWLNTSLDQLWLIYQWTDPG